MKLVVAFLTISRSPSVTESDPPVCIGLSNEDRNSTQN